MDARPMREPILSMEAALADPFGQAAPGSDPWRRFGQYEIWIGRYPAAAPPLVVQELHDGRVAEFARSTLMHRVPAGTPYRIAHLFGFWHVSDADLIWLAFERSDLTFYVALAGGYSGLSGAHAVAWYCGGCGAALRRVDLGGCRSPGQALAAASAPLVEQFNADAAARHCPACGWEHPPAYRWSPLEGHTPRGGWPAW